MSSLSRKSFARGWYAALGQTHQAGGSLEDAHPRDPSPPGHFFLLIKMTFYVRVKYVWLKATAG